jgi:SAM-dependent methyltransferase
MTGPGGIVSAGWSRALAAVVDPASLQPSDVIAERDGMFAGNREHYFSVGRSALRAVGLGLLAGNRPEPRRILDLPCGHGRVLRMLHAAWPDAEITACDLDHDGVDWCERAFGAVAVPSVVDPDDIPLERAGFDLAWCGSLLTHVDADRWDGFLRFFRRVLAPGGVLVFTTHGRRPVSRMRAGLTDPAPPPHAFYGLSPAEIPGLLARYERDGFAYADYPGATGYGISISALPWVIARVERQPGLRIVGCTEYGWDDHQDVVACVRDEA